MAPALTLDQPLERVVDRPREPGLVPPLGVLPPRVFILGCQPGEADAPGIGLTAPVARATTEAIRVLRELVGHLDRQIDGRDLAVSAPNPWSGDG